MPQERGYGRQVGTPGAVGMPRPSAESYGAGFGAQLESSAGRLHNEQLQDYAIERKAKAESEWAAFQHGFALHRENMDGIAREARKDGSAGHAQRMDEAWNAGEEHLLDGLKEDSQRRQAQQLLDETRLRFVTGEAAFEEGARVDRMVTDFRAARDVSANRARRMESPGDYLEETRIQHSAIDGLGLSADVAKKLYRETDQVMAVSFLQGQIDRDPELAKAMLAKGDFDDVLEPAQLEQLLNGADVEIRRQAVAVDRAASQQKAEIRAQLQVVEEKQRQGIAVSDEEMAQATKLAGFIGDDSLALKFDGLRSDNAFAKAYEHATPLQREGRQTELAGKVKRTPQEDRELKWLEDKGPALDRRFNSDPVGYAAAAGDTPPPLDQPAERARWARERSQAYGRPVPPLSKQEATQLQVNFRAGRAQAIEVMDVLATMPAAQAAQAARQVDPNDHALAVMVTLPAAYRSLALDGRDAVKNNKTLLKPDDPRVEEAMTEQRGFMVEALRNVPPEARQAVLTVGARIAAGLVDQTGAEISANTYFKALNMALGAEGNGRDRKGGLGKWGEHWFLLPDGVTGNAFGEAIRREAAAEGGPVNPDGSRATIGNAFPVSIGAGRYEFRTDDGAVVRTAKGAPWRVTVRPK